MRYIKPLLAGASLVAFSAPALAQDSADAQQQTLESGSLTGATEGNDIVVTARRRDESLQEVPQTVNVVTAAEIEKLNLRNFTDIQALVPGLTMQTNGTFSASATVRGVSFRPEASGNNATVEFYLNEAPISSNFLFQSMFDVGQFELLRGPQGTLRGRAAPSGSITVTTRKPNLQEAGVVVNATVANSHAYKGDFALNVPIVAGVLGVRIAGVYDDNDGGQVHSYKEAANPDFYPAPYNRTKAIRASVRFEPADWISANFMYQGLQNRSMGYGQVVSTSIVTGTTPTALAQLTPIIGPYDRLGIGDPSGGGVDQQVYSGSLDLRFAGQKLSYVGSYTKMQIYTPGQQDGADYFGPPRMTTLTPRIVVDPAGQAPACATVLGATGVVMSNQSYAECTHSVATRKSHELRLSSEERIGGIFDYVIGGLYDRNENPSRITGETPVILPPASPTATPTVVANSVIYRLRDGDSTEKSIFANVVAHVGDRFELSGGLRYIHYVSNSTLIVPAGGISFSNPTNESAVIWSASAKYRFNENLMVYGTVGTSWRPGAFAIGDFNAVPSPREQSFYDVDAETSRSYELGLRSTLFGGRGRFNVSIYQQDFENYVYRPGTNVYFVNQSTTSAPQDVGGFNGFIAGVPARVRGVEAEASFQVLPRWSISGNFSWSTSKVNNGLIACNDINGDGVPDVNPTRPSVNDLKASLDTDNTGETIAACRYSGKILNGPSWNASFQTEAGFTLAPTIDGFVRGLVTITPASDNSAENTRDDTPAYARVNLYAGLRHPQGNWEVSLFAKNLFNQRNIQYGGSPMSQSIRTPAGSYTYTSEYYSATVTPPREIGVSARIAFGSR